MKYVVSSSMIVKNWQHTIPISKAFFLHELMKYVVSSNMIVQNWQHNIPISKAFFPHELIYKTGFKNIFNTRCKEVRFCNKLCEKDAHTKKPTEKQPEDPDAFAEKLLKKEVEAKMKRNAKVERNNNRWLSTPSNRLVARDKDAWKWLEEQKKKK